MILEMSIELMEYFTNSVTVRHAGGNSTLSKLFYVAVCTSHDIRRKNISKTGKYMAGARIRLGLTQVHQNWSGSLKVAKVKLGLRNVLLF